MAFRAEGVTWKHAVCCWTSVQTHRTQPSHGRTLTCSTSRDCQVCQSHDSLGISITLTVQHPGSCTPGHLLRTALTPDEDPKPTLQLLDPESYNPTPKSSGMNPNPVQLAFLGRETEVVELFKARGVAPHHLTVRSQAGKEEPPHDF